MTGELMARRTRILDWMAEQGQPVLFSTMVAELGRAFVEDAFEGLLRDGVIMAVFPEAKPGDSGRQFWDFSHVTAA